MATIRGRGRVPELPKTGKPIYIHKDTLDLQFHEPIEPNEAIETNEATMGSVNDEVTNL